VPYEEEVPKLTVESEEVSVLQVIVAEVCPGVPEEILETTGAAGGGFPPPPPP
jgi:hypothetical protein